MLLKVFIVTKKSHIVALICIDVSEHTPAHYSTSYKNSRLTLASLCSPLTESYVHFQNVSCNVNRTSLPDSRGTTFY